MAYELAVIVGSPSALMLRRAMSKVTIIGLLVGREYKRIAIRLSYGS